MVSNPYNESSSCSLKKIHCWKSMHPPEHFFYRIGLTLATLSRQIGEVFGISVVFVTIPEVVNEKPGPTA